MSRTRIRLLLAAALVSLNLFVLAGPLHAAGNTVSGNLQMLQKIALSPSAVAVITLADRSPSGAGNVIGQQRIDGATGNDAFSVQYDPTIINPKHAYTLYASVIDGSNEYQSLVPVPVITGGPTDGLVVPVALPDYQSAGQITGTIALPSGVTTSPTAVAYAAILDATTGRLVARHVIPSPATFPAPFTVSYDQALVNPDDLYVAAAGVVDGTTWYQTKSTTPITPGATFDLTVAKTGTIPGPEASGSPAASGTPAPSGTPGVSETPSATKTPKPTQPPTASPTTPPTATPTTQPTASPTTAPSASATTAPSPSVAPSGSVGPSATPGPITVTGSVTYKDSWKLTEAAVLTINVVQIDPNGPKVIPVGQTRMDNPGQVPIKFSVTLDPALLVPTSDAFLYATLIDGKEAWTSASAVKVATNGNPTDNVSVPLVFRPDLIEGDVTGAFIDLPNDITSEAWAAVALINKSDNSVLGFQSGPLYAGSGAFPFEVPFLVSNVDPNVDYVAIGNVFDGDRQWVSQAEPVITMGNPYQNVILHATQVAGPSASPSAAASEAAASASASAAASVAPATVHPAPSPTPTSSSGSGGGLDPLVIALIAGVVVVVVIVGVAVMRR